MASKKEKSADTKKDAVQTPRVQITETVQEYLDFEKPIDFSIFELDLHSANQLTDLAEEQVVASTEMLQKILVGDAIDLIDERLSALVQARQNYNAVHQILVAIASRINQEAETD
jgi:hypothetical protein